MHYWSFFSRSRSVLLTIVDWMNEIKRRNHSKTFSSARGTEGTSVLHLKIYVFVTPARRSCFPVLFQLVSYRSELLRPINSVKSSVFEASSFLILLRVSNFSVLFQLLCYKQELLRCPKTIKSLQAPTWLLHTSKSVELPLKSSSFLLESLSFHLKSSSFFFVLSRIVKLLRSHRSHRSHPRSHSSTPAKW